MYKVEIIHQRDYSFKAKSKDYEFDIALKDKGISPPDVLLASIGSCLGVYLQKYLEGAKIKADGFKISTEAEFCQEQPMRFKEVKVLIDLSGIELDGRRKESILAFIKNCPVHNTLIQHPAVSITII